jgi:hypothetical protein
MDLITKITFIVITALLNVSCTTTLNPKDFESENLATPNFMGVKPLAIKAKMTGNKATEAPLPGGNVLISEDEFTQALVDRLIETLKRSNAPIIPASERSIEIQVVKVSLQPTNTIHCVIDFNRKLGKEEFYGFQSRSKNWSYETACEEALKDAVNDVLTDRNTLRYLKGE